MPGPSGSGNGTEGAPLPHWAGKPQESDMLGHNFQQLHHLPREKHPPDTYLLPPPAGGKCGGATPALGGFGKTCSKPVSRPRIHSSLPSELVSFSLEAEFWGTGGRRRLIIWFLYSKHGSWPPSPPPHLQPQNIYQCLYNHGNTLWSLPLKPFLKREREKSGRQPFFLLLPPALPRRPLEKLGKGVSARWA